MSAERAGAAVFHDFTPDEYTRFYEFFYQKTGISFNEKKAYFVKRRLQERMSVREATSFRDYFAMLRFDLNGVELQQLVNLLTVNETYFLREDYQFDALVQGILPEIAKERTPGRVIRIWSMPCSTGEEPYSIAIHILENWRRSDEFAIEICGSDIDSVVLAKAREGRYSARSVQRVSPALRRKYFRPAGEDFQICDELRESIDFSAINLIDRIAMARMRDVDVVFCRNLLIYFDDVSRREAVELIYESMAPGGFICLGHSESMSRMSSLFRPRKFAGTIVYQKPQRP
ncbi:chemotaxis protein [Rhodoblastus sphagnicola]|uniref:Chemotaxis protein methyltransferase n=2 Tax=Rhodoblastus sphagnicola TaxID=333368 RepID=A0A2S6NCJ0_9HYPH|nr:protein-glutamate O-methyltransferase CheR [Rhodoblastus sphagnicola]PPQ32301.1 chemotaxis protein [Rhodoblastus sphagnicola]